MFGSLHHRCLALLATAFLAGIGVGYAAAPPSAEPRPPTASEGETRNRLERLQREVQRLEAELAAERERRQALEEKADELFRTLQAIHQQVSKAR